MDTFEKGVFNADLKNTSNLNDNETEGVKPIWAREVNPFSADNPKCPGCGNNLVFNPDLQGMVCDRCGGMFHAKTLNRIAESKSFEVGELTAKDEAQHEITCNSCGAQIVADKNTSATSCPFCGSPALIIGRLSRKFEPDYIIPFKFGKEEAQKAFLKWGRSNKFIRSDFVSHKNIENITGIYVPFWLTDAECTMVINGTGNLVLSDNMISSFDVSRACTINFDKIPFDGSKKWDDTLMEAIEPFDYKDMKPYSEGQGYISGFMAERYDIPHIKMSRRIVGRIKRYIREEANMMAIEYDRFSIFEDNSTVEKMNFYYCLAPIWFVNYNYNGQKYQFVMNGQTGTVAGDVPISFIKKAAFNVAVIIATILVSAALLTGAWLLLTKITHYHERYSVRNIPWDIGAFIAFQSLCGVIFVVTFVYYYLKNFKYQRDLDNAKPKSSQYVRNTRYSDLIRRDELVNSFRNEELYKEIMWAKKHPHLKDNMMLNYAFMVVRGFCKLVAGLAKSRRRWFF